MNPSNKNDIICEDIKSLSLSHRIYLAQNSNTSTKILEQLATDENVNVRYCVARNPNTPHYIKKYLKIQEHLARL